MPSIIPGFEYDIFISYRQKDNRGDRWVTEFVNALKSELDATFKDDISIYFDENPHDGLLETHDVDESLKKKLKCLVFIPIISQTYCDPKSFAWNNEFLVFKKLASEDPHRLKIKLQNGNVASRILPVRIHELDERDKSTIENEIGPLRAIDFIFRSSGVNRPLLAREDSPHDNQNKTYYRNQINKVANAVKEIINAAHSDCPSNATTLPVFIERNKKLKTTIVIAALTLLIATIAGLFYFNSSSSKTDPDEITTMLDRADQYFEEAARFHDDRYLLNAAAAAKKALSLDTTNERAMFILATALDKKDTLEYFRKKIASRNKNSFYGFMLQAALFLQNRDVAKSLHVLKEAEKWQPNHRDLLRVISFVSLSLGDYESALTYAGRYQKTFGKGLYNLLSDLYLQLGDFKASRKQLELKQKAEEFSCDDIESYQKIFLCEGNFEKLERVTDSICSVTKCKECPFWTLRAKMHVGKFKEASRFVSSSLDQDRKITWRYPAYVLSKVGKKDSAQLVSDEEFEQDMTRMTDTTYQSIYLYSLASIYAMRGNYKESIKWLRQYADKGFMIGSEWYILHDPLFDEMQKNNEYFADMMQIVQKAQASKLAIREKIRALEETRKK